MLQSLHEAAAAGPFAINVKDTARFSMYKESQCFWCIKPATTTTLAIPSASDPRD